MKIFVFTCIGQMEGMHILRADLEALAKSKGNFVKNKVTCLTDYLVTDSTIKTQKRKTADAWQIPIVTTAQFIDMMGGEIELKETLGL